MTINWRDIKTHGYPTDHSETYLVTDGHEIATTQITGKAYYERENFEFSRWTGDPNTYEDNSCCSGTRSFDLVPTHWCPAKEINLPK